MSYGKKDGIKNYNLTPGIHDTVGIGLLLTKIEFWSFQYDFSFQFWGVDNNNAYIYRDDVELICYAMRDFNQYDLKEWLVDTAVTEYDLGIMTLPSIEFINEPSKELQAQSQKIKIEFSVSYYQNNAITTARKLILEALITVLPNPDAQD